MGRGSVLRLEFLLTGRANCVIYINTLNTEMTGMISINLRDSRPIYEQVRDSLRILITSGVLVPGAKLPSVRELATELAINPNTIQRAYRELEADGYIATQPGRGSFVLENPGERREREQQLWKQLGEAAAELRWMGVTEDALIAFIKEDKNDA